jgi:predicted Zn-dependent peptidase
MKRLGLLVLCLMVKWLFAQSPLEVKVFKLSNGFTVWVNEDHTQPKVFGAVVVKAGAKDSPNTGIAHYFEHLLFKGTDKIGTVDYAAEKPWLDSIAAQYDLLAQSTDPRQRLGIQRHINQLSAQAARYAIPNEFEQLITRYGGTGLNAYTSFDETVYYNTFSPQYMAQWCELNAERLVSPVYRLFQGELETVYEEKNMYADQMVVQAAEAAQRSALSGTPYAWPIIGSTENLKNPRMSEMRQFYDSYYVAGNMGLVLCGDMQVDSLLPLLERTFGRVRAGNAPLREKAKLKDMRGMPELKVKLPIPIVKAAGYAFKAPDEHSADRVAYDVMCNLLSNSAKTGLLDSLVHAGKLMFAGAMGYDFKDFSVYGFGYVPSIPFGSNRKADRLCWQQIDKLRLGQFADDRLDAAKRELQRSQLLDLENISSRSKAMINTFSHDLPWQQVLEWSAQLAAVSHDDVVAVARKYFNDDSLKVSKKFGRYPKEHVSQPGYSPVRPLHAGERSAYAKYLATLPLQAQAPKLVDFERDAHYQQLAPLVRLYTVPNPMNDIFTLQLVYRRGTWNDRRLQVMADYLNDVGTERLGRQQWGRALQQLGASMTVEALPGSVTVTVMGFDGQLLPTLRLLQEWLAQPEVNERRYEEKVKGVKLEQRAFLKDNGQMADALWQMVEYGDSSSYLLRMSAKEMKRLDAKLMVELFKQLQHNQLDVVYTGKLRADEIRQMVERHLPLSLVSMPRQTMTRRVKTYQKPTVYIYDMPKARQNIIGTYQSIDALTHVRNRAELQLWGNYFGGGMSSLMFQDIREFRAFAYSVRGMAIEPDWLTRPTEPCAYITRMGTQADKSMAALAILDSLFTKMPVRPSNMDAARQQIVNGINNGYPSFRAMGRFVADCRLMGYRNDPDADLVHILPTLGVSDVEKFYRDYVQGRTRVVIIVGNKKALNLQKLREFGQIIELKSDDFYRH